MIDPEAFHELWSRLCRRFSRKVDNEEMADYLAYLEAVGLDTEQVTRAIEAVWATREFFPRPADFLAGEASGGWTAIRAFASKWTPYLSSDDARLLLAAIPPRALKAMQSLGGIDVVKEAKDYARMRREYFDAFDRVLIEESAGPLRLNAPQLDLLPSSVNHDSGAWREDD